ncbi:MAG: response regulator [Bacteroidales bacterium]|nr:response regulator [Bacteroidales bacterium]
MGLNTDINHTILVVEDDMGLQYLIKTKLEDDDYNIITAASGAEAIEHIKSKDIFLMLLDYKLSDITGKELLQQLKEENLELPFVFMTGFGDERIAVDIMKLGAKDYLVKTGGFLNQLSIVIKRAIKEIENDSKLIRMQKELESLNNIKSQFLNMISNEIKTPLTGISGALHLLRNQEFSSTIKELLETLQDSVYRLDNFANTTILSTQISSGEYKLNITPINIKELLQYSYLNLTNKVLKEHIEIIEDIDSSIIINSDRDLLYKCFGYIMEDTISGVAEATKMEVTVATEDEQVKCSFFSYGDVLIENPDEFLLNPFQISPDSEIVSNWGLNLFVVNQIVNLFNGDINLTNKEEGLLVELILKDMD